MSVKLFKSWKNTAGSINTLEGILDWIEQRRESTHVCVRECSISESAFWFYDDYNGEILNEKSNPPAMLGRME